MKKNCARYLFATQLALAALLLVAGCAHYEPKPLVPGQTASALEARTLTDASLRTFFESNAPGLITEWPLRSWDFEKFTLAAFYYHPSLDVARAQWAITKAGKTTAGERPNPTLSVAPGRNTTTLTPTPWMLALNVDIPIETAGKRGYRLALARHLSEAARLNIASAAWQVRGHLRRSLVDLYAAREVERLLVQQRTTQEQVVRLLDAQLAAGAVSPFEVTQARIALDRTRLGWHDAERQRAEAHTRLASAIGVPVSALDLATLSFADFTQLPPDLPSPGVRRQALFNRADILGALAEYAASESALQLEIARQYPDVHLSPGYDYDQAEHKWSLGLSLTLPVLNQNQGPIAEAEARRAELAAQFIALQARVLGELDRAAAAYRAALAKAATADTLLANLKKQEQSAQVRLESGEISRLELSSVQLESSQAALARLDAQVKAQQAFGDLEEALQSPAGVPNSLWTVSPRTTATTNAHEHE